MTCERPPSCRSRSATSYLGLKNAWDTNSFARFSRGIAASGQRQDGARRVPVQAVVARLHLAVVTNDIYTRRTPSSARRHAPGRARPRRRDRRCRTRHPRDASMTSKPSPTRARSARLELVLHRERRRPLARPQPELVDVSLRHLRRRRDNSRKGGPGFTRSDLLASTRRPRPHVGASLALMERDARRMRRSPSLHRPQSGDGAHRS